MFGLAGLVSGGLGLLGSYQAQRKLGEAQDSMREAGDRAFKEGQYKPYGVTSGAGTASFKDGQASFNMDPRYRAQQEQMFGLGTSALDRAGGSYDDLATQMYNRQRNIGAGAREGEAQRLGERMFGSGTGGLRVSGEALGAGTGSGMLSPDGYGFAQAFAQQDAIDRNNAFAQAQQQRADDIAMGTGMFSQGQAMDDNALAMIGAGGQLGAQQSAANNAAMNNYMSGYGDAADFTARRGQSIAGGLTGLGSSLGSFSGLGGGGMSRGGSSNVMGVNNSYSPYSMMPSSRNISNYQNASFGEAGRMSPQTMYPYPTAASRFNRNQFFSPR